MPDPTLTLRGIAIYKGWLSPNAQRDMVADLRAVVAQAPLFAPVTPSGKKMSVRMTSAGRYGWVTDRRATATRPVIPTACRGPRSRKACWTSGARWQVLRAIPIAALSTTIPRARAWGCIRTATRPTFHGRCCRCHWAMMRCFAWATPRGADPTESIWLNSGDVLVMGGDARLTYHGVDRIRPGSSTLLEGGGRINLTCRVVD